MVFGRALPIIVVLALAFQQVVGLGQSYPTEIAYGGGDWLRYRFVVSGRVGNTSFNCVFVLHVDIVLATQIFATVSYNLSMASGDQVICSAIFERLSKSFSTMESLYLEGLRPENATILVNPSYTGEYVLGQARARYVGGVLISFHSDVLDEGFTGSVALELIDTSISGLRSRLRPEPAEEPLATYMPIIIVSLSISVASIAFIAFVITRTRRLRAEQQVQEAPTQAPTPAR